MISTKIKILAVVLMLFLLGILGFSIYNLGIKTATINCKEKEIQVKTETVEVVKYIYKDDSKIYIRPNDSFKVLLDRMKKGEI